MTTTVNINKNQNNNNNNNNNKPRGNSAFTEHRHFKSSDLCTFINPYGYQ